MSETRPERHRVANLAPWGRTMTYARAVRVGNVIEISGTTATDPTGAVLHAGDPAEQMRACLQIISNALHELDSGLADVVRTRIFATHAADWEVIGAVHDEFFRDVMPVSSLIGVSWLVHPDLRVEVEVTAVVSDG